MHKQLLNIFGAAAILMIFIAGCRSGQEQPDAEPSDRDTIVTLDGRAFRPDLPAGNVLDTIIKADLDGTGSDEVVVTSMRPDSMAPPDARLDYLQIYGLDSLSGRYRLLLSDSMRWGTEAGLGDLSTTGSRELIIPINSGGNDVIASKGMHIYSGAGGTVRRVYSTSRGNPFIEQRLEGRPPLLIVTGQYWPPFLTHAQAISYNEDYLVFRNGEFISDRSELRERSMGAAQLALKDYAELRKVYAAVPAPAESSPADSLEPADTLAAEGMADTVHPLFIPAARAIINFKRAEAIRSLRSFWGSEREFLQRRLPPAQFAELEQISGG